MRKYSLVLILSISFICVFASQHLLDTGLKLGTISTGDILDVETDSTFLYICAGDAFIRATIENDSLIILEEHHLEGKYAYDCYIADSLAYVANGKNGIVMFNIADSLMKKEAIICQEYGAEKIEGEGIYLYVMSALNPSIYDLDETYFYILWKPAHWSKPYIRGMLSGVKAYDFCAVGDYVYYLSDETLNTIYIGNYDNPIEIRSDSIKTAKTITEQNGYFYAAGEYMTVLTMADHIPVIQNELYIMPVSYNYKETLLIEDSTLIAGCGYNLYFFDISIDAVPEEIDYEITTGSISRILQFKDNIYAAIDDAILLIENPGAIGLHPAVTQQMTRMITGYPIIEDSMLLVHSFFDEMHIAAISDSGIGEWAHCTFAEWGHLSEFPGIAFKDTLVMLVAKNAEIYAVRGDSIIIKDSLEFEHDIKTCCQDDSLLFCGSSDDTLYIYNINNILSPLLLSKTFKGNPGILFSDNNRIVMRGIFDYISIIDATDPFNPVLYDSLLAGDSCWPKMLQGDTLFCTLSGKTVFLNISDPGNPSLIYQANSEIPMNSILGFNADTVFIEIADYIQIIRLNTDGTYDILDRYPGACGIKTNNRIFSVRNNGYTAQLLDYSSTVSKVKSIAGGLDCGDYTGVQAFDNEIYCTRQDYIDVYDISNISMPQKLEEIYTDGINNIKHIEMIDDTNLVVIFSSFPLYMYNSNNCIRIIDRYTGQHDSIFDCFDIFDYSLRGKYLNSINSGGIEIYDISDPKQPASYSAVQISGAFAGAIYEKTAYVMADRLYSYSVADINNINCLDSVDIDNIDNIMDCEIRCYEDKLYFYYINDYYNILKTYNINDPRNIALLDSSLIPLSHNIDFSGNRMYLEWGGQIYTFNLNSMDNYEDRIAFSDLRDFTVSGDRLFVAADQGVFIYSIIDDDIIDDAAYINKVSGNVLYVYYANAEEECRLDMYDINGRKVETLFEGETSIGRNVFTNTKEHPSGRYFIKGYIGDSEIGESMIILK